MSQNTVNRIELFLPIPTAPLLPPHEMEPEVTRRLVQEFLARVATGVCFETISLISALSPTILALNRSHLPTVLAALCSTRTVVRVRAPSRNQTCPKPTDHCDFSQLAWAGRLDAGALQNHQIAREFYDYMATCFGYTCVTENTDSITAVCRHPSPVPEEDLLAALRFEFDLPYPDGSHLGLVTEAEAAFVKRMKSHKKRKAS